MISERRLRQELEDTHNKRGLAGKVIARRNIENVREKIDSTKLEEKNNPLIFILMGPP
jgi:hypothetical protein